MTAIDKLLLMPPLNKGGHTVTRMTTIPLSMNMTSCVLL